MNQKPPFVLITLLQLKNKLLFYFFFFPNAHIPNLDLGIYLLTSMI